MSRKDLTQFAKGLLAERMPEESKPTPVTDKKSMAVTYNNTKPVMTKNPIEVTTKEQESEVSRISIAVTNNKSEPVIVNKTEEVTTFNTSPVTSIAQSSIVSTIQAHYTDKQGNSIIVERQLKRPRRIRSKKAGFLVNPDLYDYLAQAAREDGKSMNDLIEEMLLDFQFKREARKHSGGVG